MLPDEQHVLTILKTTMRLLGYSNRDLERELKLSGSYLSRLFSGNMDLRFSHLQNLSRAMGLEPEEILLLAYPPTLTPQSAVARRLAVSLAPAPEEAPVKPGPTVEEQQLEEAVERVVASLLGKLSPGLLGSLPEPAEETLSAALPRSEPARQHRPRRQRQSKKPQR